MVDFIPISMSLIMSYTSELQELLMVSALLTICQAVEGLDLVPLSATGARCLHRAAELSPRSKAA